MILEVTCDNFSVLLNIASYIFTILQWVIPILLILLITVDVLKALIANDEKAVKAATSKALKRVLYGVIIFFIPILVKLIFKVVDSASIEGYKTDNSATSWVSCFNRYFN